MSIRVRFAPSPTGYLHVGGARTAMFNWLYAKAKGGVFILRIEDTDTVRSTEEAMNMQLNDLKWLGLDWDEGPFVEGPHKPYRQSQRKEIYKEHTDRLFEKGLAYYCFCTDEELEKKKTQMLSIGRPPHYDGTCRNLPLETAKARLAKGDFGAIRFKVPKKDYVMKDLIRGDVNFPADMVGDFVMLRANGLPVYNFCCVVDDALMKITHVLRAEEHLSNTVRQLMLYEAFGYEPPIFAHMSLILGMDRQKLSKRHGATACNEYREGGYLPEALKNYLAFLGWSHPEGKEILTVEEIIKVFDTERMNPAPAIFDEGKLRWVNAQYVRSMPNGELWKRVEPYLKAAGLEFEGDDEWKEKTMEAYKTAMEVLTDAVTLLKPLADNQFALTAEAGPVAKEGAAVIQTWKSELEKHGGKFLTENEFDEIQKAVQGVTGAKGKTLFPPIRVAVVGMPQGVEVKKLIPLLSRKSLLWRADQALKNIN